MGVGCTFFDFLCRFWGHPVSNIPMPNKTCQDSCLRVLFQFSQQLAVQWLTRANKPFFRHFETEWIWNEPIWESSFKCSTIKEMVCLASGATITDSTTLGVSLGAPKSRASCCGTPLSFCGCAGCWGCWACWRYWFQCAWFHWACICCCWSCCCSACHCICCACSICACICWACICCCCICCACHCCHCCCCCCCLRGTKQNAGQA